MPTRKSVILELADQGAHAVNAAGLGLRHAASQIGEDLGIAAQYMSDPRMAGIGLGPEGALLSKGAGAASALFGILAGPKSKTANHALLALAQDLEKTGAPQRKIWEQTGWFKAPDGGWRYEISDHAASLAEDTWTKNMFDKKLLGDPDTFKTVGEAVSHPDLYAAYPELSSTLMGRIGGLQQLQGLKGAYDPAQSTLFLAGGRPDAVKSVALHELQHAVQQQEGFGLGGSVNQFLPKDFPQIKQRVDDAFDQVVGTIKKSHPSFNYYTALDALGRKELGKSVTKQEQDVLDVIEASPVKSQFYELLKQKNDLARVSDDAFNQYQALAGETEARLVQKRHAYTPPQRAASFPWDDYDVAPARQIVKTKR